MKSTRNRNQLRNIVKKVHYAVCICRTPLVCRMTRRSGKSKRRNATRKRQVENLVHDLPLWRPQLQPRQTNSISGGGGATQQSFIREGSAPRSKPLPFYIPFLREKVPLLYTFRRKWHPFHVPTERVLLNFSFEKLNTLR